MSAKTYFKNLDGLRFVAALTVALSHLETIKEGKSGAGWQSRFFEHSAQLSVTFFFVLSGFLIMWWFLEETKGETKKINITSFYINRISRTWPLYFLIVLLSMAISCINGSFYEDALTVKRYALYLLFLPNTVSVGLGADIYLGPTWSLAVEEFFYALFPLLLLRIPKERLLKTVLVTASGFFIVSICLNPIFLNLVFDKFQPGAFFRNIITFFERYRMYSFLSGAGVAIILYFHKTKMFPVKKNLAKSLVVVAEISIGLLFLSGTTFSFLTHQVYSVLFALLLFLMVVSHRRNAFLNNRWVAWGGKISYGIYMLHMFVVMRLVNQGAFLIEYNHQWLGHLASWLLLSILTLLLAHVSYRYFELPVRTWLKTQVTAGGKSRNERSLYFPALLRLKRYVQMKK